MCSALHVPIGTQRQLKSTGDKSTEVGANPVLAKQGFGAESWDRELKLHPAFRPMDADRADNPLGLAWSLRISTDLQETSLPQATGRREGESTITTPSCRDVFKALSPSCKSVTLRLDSTCKL